MDISQLQRGNVVRGRQVDTTAHREQRRQRRLWTMVVVLGGPLAWCVARELSGHPVRPGVPDFVRDHPEWVLPTAMLALVGVGLLIPYISAGRAPHTVVRPHDSTVRLSDVVGAAAMGCPRRCVGDAGHQAPRDLQGARQAAP